MSSNNDVKKRKKRSLIWNFFEDTQDEHGNLRYKCKICLDSLSGTPTATNNLFRHLNRKHPKHFTRAGSYPTKSGRREDANIFSVVVKNCIDLVKVHHRPIELFNDVAFQNILTLLPLKMEDKVKFNSEYIEKLISNDEEWIDDFAGDDADDDKDDRDHLQDDYEETNNATKSLKRKMSDNEEQSNDADDNIGPTIKSYWSNFEISIETAKCKLCYKQIYWQSMTDLKAHLNEHHSDTSYKDDDDEVTPEIDNQENSNIFKTEEVYIDNSEHIFNLNNEATAEKIKRKTKGNLKPPSVTLKNSEKIDINNFVGLDRFGLYVAFLMRNLPASKCVKYQGQIINKLLQEQAQAG